jgi:branched-chain amino acid transport system permease protein
MPALTTILVQAVIISALYALVAVGFTLIFGVGGVLNLSHGATITVGAFGAYYVAGALGLGVWGGLVGAMVAGAGFAAVVYLGLVQWIEDEPIMVMITTLVTAVAVEQLVLTVFGAQPVALQSIASGIVTIGGSRLQMNQLVVFAISWLIIGGLFAFVNYTKAGKALLATSMTRKGAALVGIESDRITLLTWIVAGALAGVAGLFLGSFQGASWAMGRTPLVLSFTIVVIGGIGSIRGSVVGAYLIGFLEIATRQYIDPSLTGMAPLVVLILVLLAKPEGLFGRELVEA